MKKRLLIATLQVAGAASVPVGVIDISDLSSHKPLTLSGGCAPAS